MKKKIVIFLAIVSIFVVILSLSAFADNFDYYGLTITNGSTIVFKNNPDFSMLPTGTSSNLNFTSDGSNYRGIRQRNDNSWGLCIDYLNTNSTSSYWSAYRSTSGWTSTGATIRLNQDFTLQDNAISNFIISNAVSGLPEPPPPPPDPIKDNALANTNAIFGTTLSVMSVIITWLIANQIALCGLYLYILIACIGIGKRFVKT